MTVVVAGMASGMVMALVFVSVWVFTLLSIAKNPSPQAEAIFKKFPANNMALAGAVFAYPAWTLIGTVLGLFYHVSTQQAPGGGMGSPNMLFTIAVVAATGVSVLPLFVFFWRFYRGLLVLTLGFVGVFGWFLPYFVSAG